MAKCACKAESQCKIAVELGKNCEETAFGKMTDYEVHTALDLGSDTMKISYAYNDCKCFTGKIVDDPLGMTAVPAVAYYDTEEKKWLFGAEVDSVGEKPFITVVKICDLLRLLQPVSDQKIENSNRDYYFNKYVFPKFYFPQREVLTADIEDAENHDMTFYANETPATVCERYFEYIHNVVVSRLELLFGKHYSFTVVPCVVYPQFSDAAYIDELKRLVTDAFSTSPAVMMSMAKALCAYARHSERLNGTDKSIIFNFGEEKTSLVKVTFSTQGVSIDGVDGHNLPIELGGKDIDDAVAGYIDDCISKRETMGRPSCGVEGHIAESALHAKQYLFVKDIKSAKVILGMPIYDKKAFRCGVPISASRDLLIQRTITREQFAECIGITGNCGVVRKFAEYIKSELARPINDDVRQIFLTGGPVETYGFVDYIREQMRPLGIAVLTFERSHDDYNGVKNDGYNIMEHEDALYAPSIGCAVASLFGMTFDLVLALTYGIRLFRTGKMKTVPYFKVLVDKGSHIPPDGATYFIPKASDVTGITTGYDSKESAAMHIMSTFFSSEDIKHLRKYPTVDYYGSNGENLLVVDTDDHGMLRKLQTNIGLRVLNGNIDDMSDGSKAQYFYDGQPVKVREEVNLILGVEIDGDGRAKAFARNDKRRNRNEYTTVEFLRNTSVRGNGARAGSTMIVSKKDIDFKFGIETQLT